MSNFLCVNAYFAVPKWRATFGLLPWRPRSQHDLAAKSCLAQNFIIWSLILHLLLTNLLCIQYLFGEHYPVPTGSCYNKYFIYLNTFYDHLFYYQNTLPTPMASLQLSRGMATTHLRRSRRPHSVPTALVVTTQRALWRSAIFRTLWQRCKDATVVWQGFYTTHAYRTPNVY